VTLQGNAKTKNRTLDVDEGRPLLEDIVVGKDVLELVSSAMYIDPLTVYREYVQNAADAIDDARRDGLFKKGQLGRVDVAIDPETRSVRIRDNGSGIAWKDFARKLTALGASGKRGTQARGFRGVGRLAGLGYAQELVFRSRTEGEALVSELRWDCRALKAALRAAEADRGVAELIRSIVSVSRIDGKDYPARFFEVEMKGIVRLRSDRMMSSSVIADYLSQVAPVPFSPEFKFGAQITEALRATVDLGEIDLRIDGMESPIFRPHRNDFFVDDKRALAFDALDILEVPGIDGERAAIAWILHHEYEGALPNAALMKGLRLRSGNVQVGETALLEELFSEPRFNVWSVGEVHIIDRRIVPNGRRDHFEQNAQFHNLLNHLAPTARDISRRCRTSSIRRKWLREFEFQRQSAADVIKIIRQRSVGKAELSRFAHSGERCLLQMEKIAAMNVFVPDGIADAQATISKLRQKLNGLKDAVGDASPLARVPKAQRKNYERFFELIYKCSANQMAAKALIDRILQTIK
jgi:molecular chaperone HtpG